MKQTIFQYFEDGKMKIEHKIDFIYEPTLSPEVENLVNLKIGDQEERSFSIHKMVDQFTSNPNAQIRFIKLVPHEKQFL